MISRRLILATLCLPAVARAQDSEAARRHAIRQMVAGQILPGHAGFAAATARFAAATRLLETEADAAHADAARAAWTGSAIAFQRIRHLRFGPMDAFDRAFRIAFFPDPRNSIGREMTELLREADPASITEEAFQRGRIAAQGLPAAERLLFGAEAPRLLAPDEGFRRSLLAAIGRNLATIGQALEAGWTHGDPPYGQVLEGAPGTAYRDPSEGLLVLFKSLHGGLEFLAERQVARVLGASAQAARPRSAEAWRSGESLALIRASLAALAELHRLGFDPLLRAADPELAREIAGGFAEAAAAGAAIMPGLEEAVGQPAGRAAVEALLQPLGKLRRLLTERAAPAIGIPVGFNSMDGD